MSQVSRRNPVLAKRAGESRQGIVDTCKSREVAADKRDFYLSDAPGSLQIRSGVSAFLPSCAQPSA